MAETTSLLLQNLLILLPINVFNLKILFSDIDHIMDSFIIESSSLDRSLNPRLTLWGRRSKFIQPN